MEVIKKVKDYILFILGFVFLIGAISQIGNDIAGVIMFMIISIFFLFFSRNLIINTIFNVKKKKLILDELEEKIKQSNILIQQSKEKIDKIDNDFIIKEKQLLQIKTDIEKLELEKSKLLRSIQYFHKTINEHSIEYVDNLEGLEFEEYIANLLKKIGYKNVKKTPY